GRPKLIEVLAAEGFAEDDVLRLAASLERGSEHPLAEAIVSGAEEQGVAIPPSADFASHTGRGVSGTVEGRPVALGNAALMEQAGVDPQLLVSAADERRSGGQGVMFAAVDGALAGLLVVADPIKDSAVDAI